MIPSFHSSKLAWVLLALVMLLANGLVQADQPAPLTKEGSATFRQIVKNVLPAVVSIQSSALSDEEREKRNKELEERKKQLEELLPEQFRERLRDSFPDEVPDSLGFGSGAIIDKKGVVLTNNHVVENAKEVVVIMTDGREFRTTDIVRDPKSDIAIVRLKEEDASSADLPVAKLGDSDQTEIGDWVLAMGSPFGLTGSVTSGIISAKGRSANELNLMYKDFIQTDAAINPGNSGGPLVDLDGQIIGINTAIRSSTGSFGGIGFAIPSNMAKRVAADLEKFGRVRRSYLGIAMRPLERKELDERKIDGGVEVTALSDGPTPARKAGLQPKDVIIAVDDQKVERTQELQRLVSSTPAGETVTMKVLRGSESIQVAVVLEEQPEQFGMVPINTRVDKAEKILGMTVAEQKGRLTVIDVEADSPAADAGINAGDVIVEAEYKAVTSAEELRAIFDKTEKNVLLKIIDTDGSPKLLVIKKSI